MFVTRTPFSLLFLALVAGALQAADERLPVPSADEQTKAEKLIRQLFKNEYAMRTRPGYQALAAKLAEQAADTKDDAVTKYVLYREAGTVAAMAGDLDLALKAAGQMAKQYQANGSILKAKIIESMASYYPDPNSNRTLAEYGIAAVNEAIENDDYEAAARLLKITESAAKTGRNVPLVTAAGARTRELETLKAEYEKIKKVLAGLQDKPDNPDANLDVGKYFCLQKGKWDRGLPHLAKSNELKYKDAAERDLANPKDPSVQIEVGESWLALAEKEKEPAKKQARWRARFWFEQALDNATGDTRTKAEGYLKDIPPRDATSLAKTYLSDMQEFDVKVGYGSFGKKGQLGYGQKADSLSVNAQKFPNALSTHPPEFGDASVKYKLNKNAKEFRTLVAINDTAFRTASALTFSVWGDGKELWSSKPVQKPKVVQECSVSVVGVEVLELRVHCPGSYGEAQAVWLDPYILTTGNVEKAPGTSP